VTWSPASAQDMIRHAGNAARLSAKATGNRDFGDSEC